MWRKSKWQSCFINHLRIAPEEWTRAFQSPSCIHLPSKWWSVFCYEAVYDAVKLALKFLPKFWYKNHCKRSFCLHVDLLSKRFTFATLFCHVIVQYWIIIYGVYKTVQTESENWFILHFAILTLIFVEFEEENRKKGY